ncbi:unnamed protein product (macronuclear) [Paramecium tetraurelia]|uniref:RRM domain-containing protein n=1 Tax=Paramecium tetraurelia TaxID=5888 RepID=A0E953_PARTE|nr:uncharacterized protein GSPATT00024551001 [Paramecium tetraurelia]CAK91820.1 unnamed protein product [Paramecium tetraurelia]|eukprot:XP_001459217.1 hypothetical protein (macronuclear) [Paramecium tetraurelia strain d4-2]
MNSQIERNSDPPRTNVILVVITNKANKTLSHDKYFKVFSPFGTIQRMLIFERSLTWKTFVEFDNPESALKARSQMNDKFFCDDNTLLMNVYASKLTYITFQENNTGGVDYTQLRKKESSPPNEVTQSSSSIKSNPIPPQQNFQFLQSQMQFQHQMSQQIQQINSLMGQLQQACAEGFATPLQQTNDLQNQIEKQQSILKDIYDFQLKFSNLTDNYQNFLQEYNQLDDQKSISVQSSNNGKQNRKKLTLPNDKKAQNGDQIEFIQSYHETDVTKDVMFHSSDKLIDQMQVQKMYLSEGKSVAKAEDLNFNGLGLRDSEGEDDNLQEYEEELFQCDNEIENEEDDINNELFKFVDQNQEFTEGEKQKIFNKLNQDMLFDKNDNQVAHQVEKQTQQNTIEQSSRSVDNIDQLISKGKIQRQSTSKSQTLQQQQEKLEEYVNPLFFKALRKSKVIYARWFDKKVVTSAMLYNIFSIYGNIDKMIYLKERSSCLIQYVMQGHAAIAKEALNDIMFYGQQIKIFFSNYEEISLKTQPTKPGEIASDPKTQEEYFQGGEETHRIKPDSTYTLAPPCDTIQVSNLTRNSCQNSIMQQYMQDFGQIKALKILSTGNKYLCILKYATTEVALTVLANMNGLELDGKPIQINFSKQKL